MIIQQRFNVLLQLQFYNVFTNVLSKGFTDISKTYELPKIYNKKPKYWQTLVLTKPSTKSIHFPTSSGF